VRDVALRGKPLTPGNFSNHLPSSSRPDSFLSWIADQWDPSLTWDDLAWVREHWHGKIAIKGILDPQDAREAVARGVDGIVVSNHGGRQLDQVPSSIRALPDIAQAVGSECEVLMDGGIRSGLDVVKALSFGARACLIGRPWVYAVAARGEAGVEHMLSVLREEMMMAFSLVGISDVRDIDRSIVIER
jgi:L-lactate dehydrogenase (cytochrome)